VDARALLRSQKVADDVSHYVGGHIHVTPMMCQAVTHRQDDATCRHGDVVDKF
jgi:hypothetical protein